MAQNILREVCNLSILLLKNRKEGKEMSILSGIKKVIPYFKNADGNYEQLSYKTSSQTVDFDDGKTAETKLGAIKGITTSMSATEPGYAVDATTVAALNQSLGNFKLISAISNSNNEYLKFPCGNSAGCDMVIAYGLGTQGQNGHDPMVALINYGYDLKNIKVTYLSSNHDMTFTTDGTNVTLSLRYVSNIVASIIHLR